MKQHTLLIALGLSAALFTRPAWGQTTPPDINPANVAATTDVSLTPNVTGSNASIGNIYSPNLYDGSANIVVPIYRYKNDYGDYGVSFSYNTKGVKVDEIASAVGLHWQLNAGGSITRVLKDAPDEINSFCGDYTGTQTVPDPLVKGKWALAFGASNPSEVYTDKVYVDGEYDDFVVSAGSLNFTFNLGKDGFIFTHPQRRVKIELLLNGTPVTEIPFDDNASDEALDIGFHITDEQGNQYWFSKNVIATWEYYNGKDVAADLLRQDDYIASWALTKITFANGQTLLYNYFAPFGYEGGTLYQNCVSAERGPGYADHLTVTASPVINGEGTTRPAIISSIVYPDNVRVDFDYTAPLDYTRLDLAGGVILQDVKVSSGNSCIRYQLKQAYAVAACPPYTSPPEVPLDIGSNTIFSGAVNRPDYNRYLRLILKGIDICECGTGNYQEPYYTFEYNTDVPLPERLSGRQDYFGYYNGNNAIQSHDSLTIPKHTPLVAGTSGIYGVDRSDSASYAAAGLLLSVTNAYGGKVSFAYEGHVLSNVLQGLPTSDPLFFGDTANDGVRISRITETDPYYPGNYKQTFYTYSGGQRFLTDGYFHYPKVGAPGDIHYWYFTGIYVSPHQFVNGSNHGYSSVTVATEDQDGNLLGKKVMTFTNFSDATSGNQPRYHLAGDNKNYYQYPFANRQYIKDWELGLPLETKSYDQNNRIVSDMINTYTFSIDDSSTVNKVENKKVFYTVDPNWSTKGPAYPYYRFDSASYHPYTGTALLSTTITRKYVSDNSYVADTVSYAYDSRHNLISTTAANSKGEKMVLRNVYNYMVGGSEALPDSQPTSATINNMSNAGLEQIVSMERWKIVGSGGISDKLLDASITQYQYQDGKLLTKGLYKYSTGSPVLRSAYQGFTSPNSSFGNPYKKNIVAAYNSSAAPAAYYREVSKVTAFDAKGNPLETQMLGVNQYKAMLWDTMGNKIAEAINARNTDIASTSFEGGTITGTNQVDGNFIYGTANVMSGSAVTGKKYLKLSGAQGLMCTVATPNQKYIVTFWCKGGVPVINGAGFSSVTLSNTYSLPSGWKFYTGMFTPTSGSVIFFSASATIYMDEARVFPAGAQLQSWTYEPLFGKSSETDARGRIAYYEYDKLGRLTIVRDQEGNIISKTDYHIN